MASHLLAIQVEDVNGDPVPNPEIIVRDISSALATEMVGTPRGGNQEPAILVFDLGTARLLSIELKAATFFGYTIFLKHDAGAGTFEVDARSPMWGLFTMGVSNELGGVRLRLIARRVRRAPRIVALTPTRDLAPPIVDDPAGIWLDHNQLLVGLFDDKASGFPAVMEREIVGNPDANNWERFRAVTSDVDPGQADGGHAFEWLEYGDPNGFRMLLAIWVVNRAGARPDGHTDLHFFFCPRTDIPFYAPAGVYPYKRTRFSGPLLQPYSTLGYTYLSTGGSPGSDFGIAYQAMASKRSHIVVMPLNAFGYAGPLLCRRGLHRLAREVTAYVSDNTRNTPPASSQFSAGSRQTVNRIVISGYSAGVPDVIKLFRHATISELADSYRRAKGDPQAQDFAKRLGTLNASLWQSPLGDFDRQWSEFYSVDGFFGSDKHTDFPGELAGWFAGDSQRILRVYATSDRMKSAADVVTNKLSDVFRGVTPKPAARARDAAFKAEEWHRADGRATLAWFSESFMTFRAVPYMPTADAHHTIPRVVFSHALSQSKLLQV
jgi:hypothetical protein